MGAGRFGLLRVGVMAGWVRAFIVKLRERASLREIANKPLATLCAAIPACQGDCDGNRKYHRFVMQPSHGVGGTVSRDKLLVDPGAFGGCGGVDVDIVQVD